MESPVWSLLQLSNGLLVLNPMEPQVWSLLAILQWLACSKSKQRYGEIPDRLESPNQRKAISRDYEMLQMGLLISVLLFFVLLLYLQDSR
jgi:hypothetical protein